MHKEMLNATESAQLCGIGKRTFIRLADSGRAPWGVKMGRCRRWRRDELEGWILGGCRPVDPRRGGVR
jgi:excisionase family DNA binding protein